MSPESPFAVHRDRWDPGLGRMLLLSAAAHVVVIGTLVVGPHLFADRSPRLVSYTVELVGLEKIGGTNFPKAAKPAVKKVAPKPKPKPKEKAVVVQKPAPPKPAEKPAPPPEAKAIAVAKAPTVPPTATPASTSTPAATSTPVAVAKAAATATAVPKPKRVAVAKPAPKKVEPTPVPKREAPAPKKVAAAPLKKVAPVPPAKPATAKSPSAAPGNAEEHARDERIAAAIKRVQKEVVPGGVAFGTGGSGPLSVGPGQGAGGELRGIAYVRYINSMTDKIKEGWVWAGKERDLEAVVAFSVLSSGEIANVRVTHPSGNPTYDQSAERAVRAASPLPVPPPEYADEFVQVEYTFKPEDAKQ